MIPVRWRLITSVLCRSWLRRLFGRCWSTGPASRGRSKVSQPLISVCCFLGCRICVLFSSASSRNTCLRIFLLFRKVVISCG
ncbi:hypothetical protein CPB85DRAFT_1328388 [Mucidula mucida]|nr:hypothetical protein CPB85DRAFT_1332250 [Mucidula mucida]KAF8896964.1 hypothetical protein CPB85DRAFT_1328388 [Mucidula mucida]